MKIAVFLHARISGGAHPPNHAFEGNPAIDPIWAEAILQEQINALYGSGLSDQAQAFYLCLNGGMKDYRVVKRMVPDANIILHGENAASELPTMAFIEDWVKSNPGWIVFYHHSKGVCWPPTKEGWQLRQAWRRCMTHHLVTNWTRCVEDLVNGYEMVGAHWLTSEKYPHAVPAEALQNGIWGGNFFWTTSEYLKQLKPLRKDHGWEHRYFAEMFPTNNRIPRVRDYAPHWPDLRSCVV